MATEKEEDASYWKAKYDDLVHLLDNANSFIAKIDERGCVTDWNRRAEAITGITKFNALGRPLVDMIIAEEHYRTVEDMLAQAMVGKELCNVEVSMVQHSGVRRELSLNSTPRRDADGNLAVVLIGQDITDIHAMHEEQRKVAEDLPRLIENANAPIFGVDLNGMVTEWNRKAADIVGYTKDETIGKHLVDNFIQVEDRRSVGKVLQDALSGIDTSNYELPLMSKQGKRYTVLLNATSRRDTRGRITGVVGVGQDITTLNKVVAESKLIADDLVRLIETANAPIFGIDTNLNVNEWNNKTAEITGYSKDEAMKKHLVANFISGEFKASVTQVLQGALKGKETSNFTFPLFTKTGQHREVLLNVTPRRGADGAMVGVVGVGQDITELNQQRREALRIADDLSRLIETANAPIFGVDTQGRVTEWNQKLARLSKYTKQETMGMSLVKNFITEEYKESVSYILLKALNGEETANFELPLVNNGDQTAILLLNATVRRGPSGEVIGVIGVGQDITEIRAITAEQQRVADDLSRLIENANAPILGVDLHGVVTEWNHKTAVMLGISKEEALGQSLLDFIQPGDQESVRGVLQKALLGIETSNYELRLISKTNQRYLVLLNATTRRDAKGTITGVVGVGQDITELNKLMGEANNVADDLRRLIATANAPIFGIDVEGNVNEWNRKTAEITGFTHGMAIGKHLVNSFIHEDFQTSVQDVLSKALQGEEIANYELILFTKDGEKRELLLNATPRRNALGDIVGVVGVGQDISEINRASAESRRIADDLTRLIETANAPIFGIDTAGNVNEWNAKATEVSGFKKAETTGKNLVNTFIHLEDRASVENVLAKALRGEEVANFEFPLFTRAGERREVLLNATPRRGADGAVVGVVGVGQDITELNQQRREAMRSADDLSRLIESANAPIFGVDTQGRVTEWNQKLAFLSRYTKQETMGMSLVKNFITEEYKESVSYILMKALNGEETANFEFPLVNNGEQTAMLLLNATVRRGPSGEVIGVLGVGQDITVIRAMTAEQQRVAEDLSRLIENANAPIFGVDLNGMVTEWNRHAAKLLGYSHSETFGKNLVQNFIEPENRSAVEEVLHKALQGVETANYELNLISKSRERYTVLLNATTRRGANGQVTGVVGVGQDITALNNVVAESKRVAADLMQLIETANAPIIGIDTQCRITEWNGWVSSSSGYTKAEVSGRVLLDFVSKKSQLTVKHVVQEGCQGNSTVKFELELIVKNSSKPAYLLLNATPRIGMGGDIVGVICVGQDISHIKDDEEKKSSLMAMVSHELKSPLHGIAGLAKCLADDENIPEPKKKPILMMHNCAMRLLDMVGNIMDASVLVSNRQMRMSRDPVNMGKIVDEVVTLCTVSIDKRGQKMLRKGVKLLSQVPEKLPVIEADVHRCTQLIWNLVTNALKFTHEGFVKVTADADDIKEILYVDVQDTGIGIAPENMEKIFHPFDQEDTSESRKYDGLGLGLAICREVTERHGGFLTVSSVVGQGSTFRAALPYQCALPSQHDDWNHKTPKTGALSSFGLRPAHKPDPKPTYRAPTPVDNNDETPVDNNDEDRVRYSHPVDPDNTETVLPQPSKMTEEDLECLGHAGMKNEFWTMLSKDDDDEVNQEVLQLAVGGAKLQMVQFGNGQAILGRLAKYIPQVIVLDMMMRGEDVFEVLRSVRETHSHCRLPVIMVSSATHQSSVEVKGFALGASDWIHRPFSREELVARVKSHIMMKSELMQQCKDAAHTARKLKSIRSTIVENQESDSRPIRSAIQEEEWSQRMEQLEQEAQVLREELSMKAELSKMCEESQSKLKHMEKEMGKATQEADNLRHELRKSELLAKNLEPVQADLESLRRKARVLEQELEQETEEEALKRLQLEELRESVRVQKQALEDRLEESQHCQQREMLEKESPELLESQRNQQKMNIDNKTSVSLLLVLYRHNMMLTSTLGRARTELAQSNEALRSQVQQSRHLTNRCHELEQVVRYLQTNHAAFVSPFGFH